MARARKNTAPSPATEPVENGNGEVYSLDADPNKAQKSLPSHDPNYPFLLAYHPTRWIVVDGRCIPSMGRIVLAPGMEGCEWNGGKPDWMVPAGRWAKRGWTVIPTTWRNYIRRTPVRGGYHYFTEWETLHGGTGRITSDTAGWADWIDSLFLEGKLPLPELWALEALADRTRSNMMILRDKVLTVPSMKNRVDALAADLAAVEAKIAELSQDLPAAKAETVEL